MLGFVSLLMDISSAMIHNLLPLFLVTGLRTSALDIGLIEGAAEATPLIVKIFFGRHQRLGRTAKGTGAARLWLGSSDETALCSGRVRRSGHFGRLADRVGKGILGAPRDAIVADTAPPDLRGTAFGVFNLASGIALLMASGIAGWLWDSYGAEATFLSGAGFAAIALFLLLSLRQTHQRQPG